MTLLLTHQFSSYARAKMVGIIDKVYYKAKGICILHRLSQEHGLIIKQRAGDNQCRAFAFLND